VPWIGCFGMKGTAPHRGGARFDWAFINVPLYRPDAASRDACFGIVSPTFDR
jgi:hypothetical protein